MSIHAIAQKGFGVGTNELYDRVRPSYQSDALQYIRDAIDGDSLNIVEIGAGTGIFTRALFEHPAWNNSIAKLEAVEPSSGMLEVFAKALSENSRVAYRKGTFSESTLPNEWADVIFIAQALHWCPDFNAAAAEFARILKPKGTAIFIWNLEDRDAAAWVAQVRERIERHEEGTPQFRLMEWRKIFETPNYKALFSIPDEKTWINQLPATADLVISRALSKSYIAVRPEEDKKAIERDIRTYLTEGHDMVKSAEVGGDFVYPYKTYVVLAKKSH